LKLYSYVVEHDTGFAPNPYFGICSLAHCKFGKKRKNIVELAEKGDWIIGTGGSSARSSGKGTLIYAMRVDEKLTLKKYYRDSRFKSKKPSNKSFESNKGDNLSEFKNNTDRYVLLSYYYFYFGENAKKIPNKFKKNKAKALEKIGPAYKSKAFDKKYILDFVSWLEKKYFTGMNASPCTLKIEKKRIKEISLNNKEDC